MGRNRPGSNRPQGTGPQGPGDGGPDDGRRDDDSRRDDDGRCDADGRRNADGVSGSSKVHVTRCQPTIPTDTRDITKDPVALSSYAEEYNMASVTKEDEGKRVVNQDGDTIGMVSGVEGDRVYIDPDTGITDKIKAKLGWEEVDEDDYAVNERQIEAVTDDEVRLGR